MKKIVGYITSDPFNLGFVSHQIQNQTIRSYVQNHDHSFLLSWTEYKGRTPQVFNSLLSESFYNGICFYSLEQLLHFPNTLEYLYSLKDKNIWIGFAREGQFFIGDEGFLSLLKLWWLISNLAKQETPFVV